MTWLARLRADRRGGVVVTFALAAPVIAVLALAAIDLASVSGDKQALQEVADSAALQAAKQLGIADNSGLAERTKAVVASMLADMGNRVDYVTTVTPDTAEGTVLVSIAGSRASFFVNLLPPGGWKFTVEAKAERLGSMPLCVLSYGEADNDVLSLKNNAQIMAPGCLVHSNADISVLNSAKLSAGVVQASGLANGTIDPTAQTDAPAIADPFSAMTIPSQGALCQPLDLVSQLLPLILLPGVHCGNIVVGKTIPITLLPGEHYFQKGKLELKEKATMTGDNVVLIFGKDAQFEFRDESVIRLKGRRQGAFAGFVIATTRDNQNAFEISSSSARELVGTVYVPSSTLVISGNNRVADQSAWTVIVAKDIEMRDDPDLVINKNYAGSSVPVPGGVGDKAISTSVRLSK